MKPINVNINFTRKLIKQNFISVTRNTLYKCVKKRNLSMKTIKESYNIFLNKIIK